MQTTSEKRRGPRFFYGWAVVASLGMVTAMLSMMMGPSFGLFIKPVIADLGISQSVFGLSQTARSIGYGLSSFFVGRALDLFGPRIPLAMAGLALGAILLGLAAMSTGWHLVGLYLSMGLIGLQGGGNNLYTTVPVAHWFIRKRSRAMSLTYLGVPVGVAISGPLTLWMILHLGWRTAWAILGAGGAAIIVLVALLVLRRKPDDVGQLPDGDPAPAAEEARRANVNPTRQPILRVPEQSWTRSEAIRSVAFWRLSILFGLEMLALTSIGIFRLPYYQERGIAPQLVALAVSAEAAGNLFASLSLGVIANRLSPRYLGTGGFVLIVAFFLITMVTTEAWQMLLRTFIAGIGLAMVNIVQNILWPQYFGQSHLGSIRGRPFLSHSVSVLWAPLWPAWLGTLRAPTSSLGGLESGFSQSVLSSS